METKEAGSFWKDRKVAIVQCGSFNPPHSLHMMLLECARDKLVDSGSNVVCGVLSHIPFPHVICRVQESASSVDFVEVDEDDPVIRLLSCKNEVLGVPERIPEEYLLPQWDVMEYRDPDFVNP